MEKKISSFDKLTHRESSDAEKYSVREHLFGTNDVYPMWVADMEFEASPAIVETLTKRINHKVYGYAMPDDELSLSAASWFKKRHNITIAQKNFRASPSIMTTMSAAIEAFSEKGDGVITFTPIYPPFMEVVTTQKRVLHTVALLDSDMGFVIDFKALEDVLKKSKILLLCNPHNPVGRVWTPFELEKISTLCEKHEVFIISDDAHSDLIMPGFTYTSITTVSEYAKENSLTLFGPGKGFNISGLSATMWFTLADDVLSKMDKVFKARHIVSGHFVGFNAIKAAYNESESWLESLLPYLDKNMDYACEELNMMGKFKVHKPEGTYLIWIDCKGLEMSDLKIKDFFVNEAKLGLSMGRFFGTVGQGFMRMNCAVPFKDLENSIALIKNAVENLEG